MLSGTESTLHIGTPGEMKRTHWLSTAKHSLCLTHTHSSLAEVNVGRAWVCLVCVCVCVVQECVCEYIKSVRYQQSTIHQMNKNNRSNPDVILLLRLWCHDVIGNYSSATTKRFLDTDQIRVNTGTQTENFQVMTIKTHTQLTEIPKIDLILLYRATSAGISFPDWIILGGTGPDRLMWYNTDALAPVSVFVLC